MKRFFKRAACFLALLTMAISCFTTVSAAGSITYDGNARKFIFGPGGKDSPTDLFENFKSVMPGDSITQQLLIKNEVQQGVKIKLYIKSNGANEGSEKFLSQMKLSVKQGGESQLFNAPADQAAQLSDWAYLGTVYSGGKINLNVTLDVPITMGDDFQSAVGTLDWMFKVEEYPAEDTDPKPVDTGESGNLTPWFWLPASSAAILIFLLLKKRRATVKG